MEDWKKINVPYIAKIERVVAVFEVQLMSKFPEAKVKIKILERSSGNYSGFTNIAAKSRRDGTPDWTSGMGDSVSSTLEDTIHYFLRSIEENGAISADDFEWSEYGIF